MWAMIEHSSYRWHSGRRRRQETRTSLFWLIGVISTAIRYWHSRTPACCLVCQRPTSSSAKRGLFTRQDFVYDAEKDHYTCPAGQHLTRGRVRSDRRQDVDNYRHLTACFTCPLKPRCTPDKLKRVKRWEHEDVLDAMQARLDRMPDAMLVRRQTVEHPYGTIKAWMGSTHFLTRTLKRVSTEMGLHVLAYNIKRVIAIIGVGPLLQVIRA